VEVALKILVTAKKNTFATNGFANALIGVAVKPARAQVLITEPIKT
jgi:hypothetical protein